MPQGTVLFRIAGGKRGTITARRAAVAISFVTVTITIASGIAMRWVDSEDFDSVWDGMWWAVQTVTTVGYGDQVPKTGAGRLLATLVMLTAIGFISVVTASITAAFIESSRRRLAAERRLHPLVGRKGLPDTDDPDEALSIRLDDISDKLAQIETLLQKRAD